MSAIVFSLLIFLLVSASAQILYFLFLRKTGIWPGFTMATEGMIFALAFGFTAEILFWTGWVVLVLGILLIIYALAKKTFLPNWMNKILYHPKLNKL